MARLPLKNRLTTPSTIWLNYTGEMSYKEIVSSGLFSIWLNYTGEMSYKEIVSSGLSRTKWYDEGATESIDAVDRSPV